MILKDSIHIEFGIGRRMGVNPKQTINPTMPCWKFSVGPLPRWIHALLNEGCLSWLRTGSYDGMWIQALRHDTYDAQSHSVGSGFLCKGSLQRCTMSTTLFKLLASQLSRYPFSPCTIIYSPIRALNINLHREYLYVSRLGVDSLRHI